tara:strand:+ start:151 stop:399 length:249 start_codon:yes stop_codon:yes gene_type:complete
LGDLVDLSEYREQKLERELEVIRELQEELRQLISEMGGVHVVPTIFLNTPDDELDPTFSYSMYPVPDGYGYTYTVSDEQTKE